MVKTYLKREHVSFDVHLVHAFSIEPLPFPGPQFPDSSVLAFIRCENFEISLVRILIEHMYLKDT